MSDTEWVPRNASRRLSSTCGSLINKAGAPRSAHDPSEAHPAEARTALRYFPAKSTVTRLAARLLPRASRVGGDDVNLMIGSGVVWFMGKPTDEALHHDELCNRNMCSLANNFIDFGLTSLMDSVLVDRPELDFFLALLSPRPVRLVILAPGIDVCRDRNAMRDPQDRFEFDGYERLEADMKREFGDCAWWFDTAALTPEETAEQLVADAAHRAPPLQPGWNAWLRTLHRI